MKNFLLNIILLSALLPLSYGQTTLIDGPTNLKMSVKKYEVIQTEIRTTDNLLVYANTDMVFVGEKTSNIDIEKFKKAPKVSPKVPVNQFLQVNRPNSDSVIFLKNNSQSTSPYLALNTEQTVLRDKKLAFGYPNNSPVNTSVNLAALSLPENRSITNLPGYIPVASYGVKFR